MKSVGTRTGGQGLHCSLKSGSLHAEHLPGFLSLFFSVSGTQGSRMEKAICRDFLFQLLTQLHAGHQSADTSGTVKSGGQGTG